MPANHTKVIFTQEQYKEAEEYAGLRMPYWQIASLMGLSLGNFNDILRRDKLLQQAIMRGRAIVSHDIRRSILEKARGKKDKNDPDKYAYQPDFAAQKFWALSQEGFKEEHTLAVNLSDTHSISLEDKAREIQRLLDLRAIDVSQGVVAAATSDLARDDISDTSDTDDTDDTAGIPAKGEIPNEMSNDIHNIDDLI